MIPINYDDARALVPTIREARTITGHRTGLGTPSKMPGFSTSIPASACKVGARLSRVVGSVCAGCYAMKGRYLFPDVVAGLQRRLDALHHPLWVAGMVRLIGNDTRRTGVPYFRVHDSGDLQSMEHLHRWFAVARALPDVHFWIPTREQALVNLALAMEPCPENMTIRLSAPMIDGSPPTTAHAGLTTSTVHAVSYCGDTNRWRSPSGRFAPAPIGNQCPAPTQGGACGACRSCWSPDVENVSYHVH